MTDLYRIDKRVHLKTVTCIGCTVKQHNGRYYHESPECVGRFKITDTFGRQSMLSKLHTVQGEIETQVAGQHQWPIHAPWDEVLKRLIKLGLIGKHATTALYGYDADNGYVYLRRTRERVLRIERI